MNCLSCQSNIDPKWKHAIDKNVCPFCGESIMPEDLKEHISNLSKILNSFKDSYPDQLDDWLLSNHNYVRTDGEKIKDFFPKQKAAYKKQAETDEELDEGLIDVQDPEVTSKFFKNAGVSNNVKRADEFKKMISQIRSENPGISEPSVMDYPDDNDVDFNSSEDDFSEKIPASVLAFASKGAGKGSSDHNVKDILRLQSMHDKVRESRSAVVNGTGGKGSFSRSG